MILSLWKRVRELPRFYSLVNSHRLVRQYFSSTVLLTQFHRSYITVTVVLSTHFVDSVLQSIVYISLKEFINNFSNIINFLVMCILVVEDRYVVYINTIVHPCRLLNFYCLSLYSNFEQLDR